MRATLPQPDRSGRRTTSRRWRLGVVGIAASVLAVPLLLSAEVIVRSGSEITLGDTQRVSGDFYGLSRTFSTSAAVVGDVHVAAGSVVINGDVGADLSLIGGAVQVHAPVGDDVRVVGGQVVIADEVGGDVAVFGGELTVLSTADITGDILFYGGSLDMQGVVGGSIFATAERVRIDGPVGGGATVKTHGTLTLGARAVITGDVQYESPFELTRALESSVGGTVQRTEMPSATERGLSVMPLLVLLFTALAARFVLGRRVDTQVEYTLRSFGSYGLIGFGALILTPLIAVLLMISVIGSVIGAVVLALYMLLLIVAFALTPIGVGAQLATLAKKGNRFSIGWICAGALVLYVVLLIPFIGWLLLAAAVLIMFGGLLSRLYRSLR